MSQYMSPAPTLGTVDAVRAHAPSNLSYLPSKSQPDGVEMHDVTAVQRLDYRPLLVLAVVMVGTVVAGFALEALQEWASRWGGWSLSQIARRAR